jgi:hypothetical protein
MSLNLRLKHGLWLVLSAAALAGTAITGPAAAASVSAVPSHRGMLPPGNPSESLAPSPSFLTSCSAGDDGTACNRLALMAIEVARQTLEKMGGMPFSLPAYEKLTPAEQLFVVVNLERTERGLPPAVVLSTSLDKIAQAGAQAGRDPAIGSVPRRLPGGGRTSFVGATWAGGWVNPLGADYAWMYDDGLGGSNLDCRAASSGLCWGHRDVLLIRFNTHVSCPGGAGELAMGAGHAIEAAGYGESDTVLLVGVCGLVPADHAFTWATARKLLRIRLVAGRRRIRCIRRVPRVPA